MGRARHGTVSPFTRPPFRSRYRRIVDDLGGLYADPVPLIESLRAYAEEHLRASAEAEYAAKGLSVEDLPEFHTHLLETYVSAKLRAYDEILPRLFASDEPRRYGSPGTPLTAKLIVVFQYLIEMERHRGASHTALCEATARSLGPGFRGDHIARAYEPGKRLASHVIRAPDDFRPPWVPEDARDEWVRKAPSMLLLPLVDAVRRADEGRSRDGNSGEIVIFPSTPSRNRRGTH